MPTKIWKDQIQKILNSIDNILEKQPRPGLVPKSGDPKHPYRWVRPETARIGLTTGTPETPRMTSAQYKKAKRIAGQKYRTVVEEAAQIHDKDIQPALDVVRQKHLTGDPHPWRDYEKNTAHIERAYKQARLNALQEYRQEVNEAERLLPNYEIPTEDQIAKKKRVYHEARQNLNRAEEDSSNVFSKPGKTLEEVSEAIDRENEAREAYNAATRDYNKARKYIRPSSTR